MLEPVRPDLVICWSPCAQTAQILGGVTLQGVVLTDLQSLLVIILLLLLLLRRASDQSPGKVFAMELLLHQGCGGKQTEAW